MKYKIFKNVRSEDGQAALLMVLVTMSLLLLVGLFLTNTVLKQIRATKNTEQFTQAYFLADAGTERILYEIEKGNIDLNDFNAGDDLLNGSITGLGDFNVVLTDDSPLIIKAKGIYKNTARAIEISW